MLKQTATRLQEVSRTGDVVARYGGDEFVMFLDNISPDHADAAAKRMVAALSTPFVHDQRSLQLSASVGVVMHRADGSNLATLMRMVDDVMDDVKRAGKECVSYPYIPMKTKAKVSQLQAFDAHRLPGATWCGIS